MSSTFIARFIKIASKGPKNRDWFHQMHRTMNPRRALARYSRKGVRRMLARRGVYGGY